MAISFAAIDFTFDGARGVARVPFSSSLTITTRRRHAVCAIFTDAFRWHPRRVTSAIHGAVPTRADAELYRRFT